MWLLLGVIELLEFIVGERAARRAAGVRESGIMIEEA